MFVKPDGNIQGEGGHVALRDEFTFDVALIAQSNY